MSSESWNTGLNSGVSRVWLWSTRNLSLRLARVGSIFVSAIIIPYAPHCGGFRAKPGAVSSGAPTGSA